MQNTDLLYNFSKSMATSSMMRLCGWSKLWMVRLPRVTATIYNMLRNRA